MKFEIISFFAKTTTTFFLLFMLTFPGLAGAATWLFPTATQVKIANDPVVSIPVATQMTLPGDHHQEQTDTFQEGIKRIASQLFSHLEEQDPEMGLLSDGLAFTVFVDLKKLRRTSSFGRYLSEQLMTEFQQHGYQVFEVRKSQDILVQEKRGEYGLSRDSAEINTPVPARTLLTGTYTIAGDSIMVNAKIIDNKNAALLSSATVLFQKNALTEDLLADAVSAHQKTPAQMYMKKLEL